ncbi:Hypothetical predicted protein [Scomber scombrus]|uniref:Uncharacterized protein n=1 Tax=Scomber scombrus TaxID=13677 RepID=A0AAV1PQ98_SCOSC
MAASGSNPKPGFSNLPNMELWRFVQSARRDLLSSHRYKPGSSGVHHGGRGGLDLPSATAQCNVMSATMKFVVPVKSSCSHGVPVGMKVVMRRSNLLLILH